MQISVHAQMYGTKPINFLDPEFNEKVLIRQLVDH